VAPERALVLTGADLQAPVRALLLMLVATQGFGASGVITSDWPSSLTTGLTLRARRYWENSFKNGVCKNVCKNGCAKGAQVCFDLRTLCE
jgi:hypothetical protein